MGSHLDIQLCQQGLIIERNGGLETGCGCAAIGWAFQGLLQGASGLVILEGYVLDLSRLEMLIECAIGQRAGTRGVRRAGEKYGYSSPEEEHHHYPEQPAPEASTSKSRLRSRCCLRTLRPCLV